MAAIYENPNKGNDDEHVYSYCEPQLDTGTGVDVPVPVPVARGNNSVSTRIKNNVQCAALACHTVMILALLCISIFLLDMPKTDVLRQKDHHDQDYSDDNLTRNARVVARLTATEIDLANLRNHLTIAESRIDQHTSEMAGIHNSLVQAETMILNLTTSLKDYVNGTNCPDAWVAFQGSCYFFETEATRTFQESEDFCRTLGGHLTEVESIDENNFIKQQLQKLQRGDFWFALIKRRGEWTWLNTNTAPAFSDWAAGEPNFQGTDQTCGQFYQTTSFSWDDTECFNDNNRPLCEISPVDIFGVRADSLYYFNRRNGGNGTNGTAWSTDCPDTWTAFQGSCYHFGTDTPLKFFEAEHYCTEHGSHLVHVDSDDENLFIKNYLRDNRHNNSWLDLTDELVDGRWVFLDTNTKTEFTDWAPGEPNSYNHHHEDCAHYAPGYDYKWNDVPCDSLFEPICEIRRAGSEIIG